MAEAGSMQAYDNFLILWGMVPYIRHVVMERDLSSGRASQPG